MKVFGFNVNIEKRGVPSNPSSQVPDAVVAVQDNTFSFTASSNTSDYTGQVNQTLSAVYRAVELISDSVAGLPIQVKKKDNSGYSTIVEDHYLYDIFDNRNNLMTRFMFIKMLVSSVLLRGNGFAYIRRDGKGAVKALQFLHPDDVVIVYDKKKNTLYYTSPIIGTKQIEPCNMLHIIHNSKDGITGRSVISAAASSMDIAKKAENTAYKYFSKGGTVSGILETDKKLNIQQKKDIQDAWVQLINNGVPVLEQGVTYKNIQMNATDAQLLQTRQYSIVEIARFFGISPVLLGDLTHSSYNTIEAAQSEFLLHTVMPFVQIIEQELTRKCILPSEGGLFINLDESAMLRTDKTKLAEYYTKLLDKGVLSINEVRKELGMGRIDGGDVHTIAYSNPAQNNVAGEQEPTIDNE